MRAVLSACHLLGMFIQLNPLGRMRLPGLSFFIYLMGLLFFMWRFTLRMTSRKMLCPGPGCFRACCCFVLCSDLGGQVLILPCAPVLQSMLRGLGSVVSVEERLLTGAWDVSTLHHWRWPTQESSHLRGLCSPGSGCSPPRDSLPAPHLGSGAGQTWLRSQLCPLRPV